MLETHTPAATYPCCGQRAVFTVFADAGRQVMDRTCRRCGRKYTVTVRLVKRGSGFIVHTVEWDWTGRYNERIRRDYLKYAGAR